MSNITDQTLSELIGNIKSKKISSTEITKSFIDRSEKSKKLNAYVTDNFSSAIKKAKNRILNLFVVRLLILIKDQRGVNFCQDAIMPQINVNNSPWTNKSQILIRSNVGKVTKF